jgi:hypothetical protein
MGSDNRQEVIAFKELTGRLIAKSLYLSGDVDFRRQRDLREEIRATSHVIMQEALRCLFCSEVFDRVCPENIAHQTMCRWLAESIDLSGGQRPELR